MKKAANPKSQPTDNNQEPNDQNDRVEELTADLQRIQAEFINYKNRNDQEKLQLASFAKSQVVKDLLPVIDDLERALAHLPEDLSTNKWAQGVQKVHTRLTQQLDKIGIKQIDALNKTFDPSLHEAVQAEGDGDNQIVSEVLQNGYVLGDIVIRHAIVKVIHE